MFVVRQKPHEQFKRKGIDLIAEQEISLEESLVGGKRTIEHLGGKKVTLTFERGRVVKPNDVLVIEGLGMPSIKPPKTFGKLYLIVSVKFPESVEESKLSSLLKVILKANARALMD